MNEITPFEDKPSYRLISELVSAEQLKPMNLLQRNIYSTKLPEYKVKQIAWGAIQSAFMTPQQIYNSLLQPLQPRLPLDASIRDIDRNNISERIDALDERVLPQLAYKLFLEEMKNKHVEIYAESSIPNNFIRQSIKGPRFAISRGQICGPTTILDRNSNHAYALSQVDFPVGRPHVSTDASILDKPVFVVDADVEYKPQHELDHGFTGRCVLNSIDARAAGMTIKHVYRGYWWSDVVKQPLKELMTYLYSLRSCHPKMKALINSLYGKLIQRERETVRTPSQYTAIRSSPLIKEFDETNEQIIYRYYNDSDFTYNFTIVASLLLAQQR